jgi:hypothetical protein
MSIPALHLTRPATSVCGVHGLSARAGQVSWSFMPRSNPPYARKPKSPACGGPTHRRTVWNAAEPGFSPSNRRLGQCLARQQEGSAQLLSVSLRQMAAANDYSGIITARSRDTTGHRERKGSVRMVRGRLGARIRSSQSRHQHPDNDSQGAGL